MIKIINEASKDKQFKLTKDEAIGLSSIITSDARAGIIEAMDIDKKLMDAGLYRSTFCLITLTDHEIGYLSYWHKLYTEFKNSPKAKYDSQEKKDAIAKIFNDKSVNESLNESKDKFKKGDKVKVLHPASLTARFDGVIDHRCSTEEIKDAGWDNCNYDDEFYSVNVVYKGKKDKLVSPVSGITLNESVIEEAAKVVKPNGGDGKNFMMFYVGAGYPSREEIEEYAKSKGFTNIYWGSDEAYGMKGMYNGDTLVVYKDADKLPSGYKEDAKKKGEPISESVNEAMNVSFMYAGHGFDKITKGNKTVIEIDSLRVDCRAESTDGKTWKIYNRGKLEGTEKCSSEDDVAECIIQYAGLDESVSESADDHKERRIVKSIAEEVIKEFGQNNSIGTWDKFIRKMMDNWVGSGHDRKFIKEVITKAFEKEIKAKKNESMNEKFDADLDFNKLSNFIKKNYPNAKWKNSTYAIIGLNDFLNDKAPDAIAHPRSKKSLYYATSAEINDLIKKLTSLLSLNSASSRYYNVEILSGAPEYEIDIDYDKDRGLIGINFDANMYRLNRQLRESIEISEADEITKSEESEIIKQLKAVGFDDKDIKQIIGAMKKALNEMMKNEGFSAKSFLAEACRDLGITDSVNESITYGIFHCDPEIGMQETDDDILYVFKADDDKAAKRIFGVIVEENQLRGKGWSYSKIKDSDAKGIKELEAKDPGIKYSWWIITDPSNGNKFKCKVMEGKSSDVVCINTAIDNGIQKPSYDFVSWNENDPKLRGLKELKLAKKHENLNK